MKKYSTANNLTGWILFLISASVYLLTIEPTSSFWDCGEFIAASYKLEVGHPPGAPFFLLLGRFFSLFAGNDISKVAIMINAMSALMSAFTILFLFWTITHLVKKIVSKNDEPGLTEKMIILGSGIVGGLVYTFSDTFWFSAVEGEVYATSSLFTAAVFWAILKWENTAGEKYANRWIILIAYLMGLSIGVHLLNLLTIPALVLIFYFKNFKPAGRTLFLALIASASILGGIMYILIPGVIKLGALFEKVIVNATDLPYFSGFFIFILLIASLIVYGLYTSYQKGYVILNTIILVVTVILIGYSSYAMVVIRSGANPPMDQNNPDNLFNLLSYLNREQYGDRPLAYGQYFNAPIISSVAGSAVYAPVDNKYKEINRKFKYKYDKSYMTLFPRMYSPQTEHVNAYLQWTNMKKSDLYNIRFREDGQPVRDNYGEIVYDYSKPKKCPSFSKNIRFFIRYQLGHMYFRYFMWNFSGRQNDIQSHFKEEITKGNWITGIGLIDAKRLGNQDKLTPDMIHNKARNKYFLLPLVLGLLGLLFQYKNDPRNFWVVMALFFFTGIAIVIYLNQYPIQPRERDYAYAGSFYAFSIWVGMAVAALYKYAGKNEYKKTSKYTLLALIAIIVLGITDIAINRMFTFTWSVIMIVALVFVFIFLFRILREVFKQKVQIAFLSILFTIPVPILMAFRNWDDHDRSARYFVRDFASNYLNSCEKNAILFTNGDNDTFPLWYVQEVEGTRTDVRVVNLSYLSADWYINQMNYRAYESAPIKMILTPDKYVQGKREVVYLVDRIDQSIDLIDALKFVASDDVETKTIPGYTEHVDYMPQHQFQLKTDSADPDQDSTQAVRWKISRNYITKNHLMVLDFLASNSWSRPIYYAITVSDDNYLNLNNYFEMQGFAFKVVPKEATDSVNYIGGINTDIMYDNLMNRFKWGGLENKNVYIEENMSRMLSNVRHNFTLLSIILVQQGKADSAQNVMNKCLDLIPNTIIPYDIFLIQMIDNYYKLQHADKARALASLIAANCYRYLDYLISLEPPFITYLPFEKRLALHTLGEIFKICNMNGDKKFSAEIDQNLEMYVTTLSGSQ